MWSRCNEEMGDEEKRRRRNNLQWKENNSITARVFLIENNMHAYDVLACWPMFFGDVHVNHFEIFPAADFAVRWLACDRFNHVDTGEMKVRACVRQGC